MAEAMEGSPHPECKASEQMEPSRQRLLLVTPPNRSRESRTVTNLATVFGRFAEMQQLVGEQVVGLEDSIQQQHHQLADLSAQLPEMKERLHRLMATDRENETQSKIFAERLAIQESNLAALANTVQVLCDAQAEWKQIFDQLRQLLTQAHAPSPLPPCDAAE